MADPSEAPLIPEGETTSDVELSAVATGSPEPDPTLDSAPTDAETSVPVVAETPPTKTQAPAPLPPATSSQTTSAVAPSGGQTKPPPQTTASQTKPSPQTTGSQAAAAAAPAHPPPSGASILHAPLTGQEGPHEKKARDFVEQADKKIKSAQSFFGGLFGWGTNVHVYIYVYSCMESVLMAFLRVVYSNEIVLQRVSNQAGGCCRPLHQSC